MKQEIELHICLLEGKLTAFSEFEAFHKHATGSPSLSMTMAFLKDEIAFLKKLLTTYQKEE